MPLTSSQYLRRLGMEYVPGAHEVACEWCAGAGVFYSDNGPAPGESECDRCGGTGYVDSDDVFGNSVTPDDEADWRAYIGRVM